MKDTKKEENQDNGDKRLRTVIHKFFFAGTRDEDKVD